MPDRRGTLTFKNSLRHDSYIPKLAIIDNLVADNTPRADATIVKFAWIGKQFGAIYKSPLDCCHYLVDRLYGWLDDLAIARLGQFGMTPEMIDSLVEMAANKNNPVTLAQGQIRQLLLDRC